MLKSETIPFQLYDHSKNYLISLIISFNHLYTRDNYAYIEFLLYARGIILGTGKIKMDKVDSETKITCLLTQRI